MGPGCTYLLKQQQQQQQKKDEGEFLVFSDKTICFLALKCNLDLLVSPQKKVLWCCLRLRR